MRFENLTLEKKTGAVYTPMGMSRDLTISLLSHLKPRESLAILEPALGDGRLLRSVLETLSPRQEIRVVAYELDNTVLQPATKKLTEDFPHVDFTFLNKDIVEHYLGGHLMGQEFDVIIANPPYLRTQVMGADKAKKIANIFKLRGRVDIYYAFVLISLDLLSKDGVAGFVTSNRFMKVKSGEKLRDFLLENAAVQEIIDYGDTKLFDAAVLPCTFVFTRGKTDPTAVRFYSIYQTVTEERPSEQSVFPYHRIRSSNELEFRGSRFEVQSGSLSVSDADGTWSVESVESAAWLATVNTHTTKRLRDLGKVRVGIKTTADKVFLLRNPDAFGDALPELARPILTHRNAGQIIGNSNPRWMVVYPHEVRDGKKTAVSLKNFPKTSAYLNTHREQLERRKYVQDAGRQWYEVWVPQDPTKWQKPKIVFRDIADTPQFWLDTSGAIVNGDCYWLDTTSNVQESDLCLALGMLNSKFITEYYDRKVNNKLFAGKRRFMTQYVEQFPLPSIQTNEAQEIVTIVSGALNRHAELTPQEKERVNTLVYCCFGLA